MIFKYAVIFLGFLVCVPSAYAQKKHDPAKKEAAIQKVLQQLNLTDDQNEKLKEHRIKHRKKAKQLSGDIRAKRKELAEELKKSEPNTKEVKQIHSELKKLKAKKEDHRLDGILEVRKILTTEQYSKFIELRGKD
jgi:Spy/CpxP family protein refolding chaperone